MLHSINDSLTFLAISRMAICEAIDQSDVAEKESLKNYITNEASDYEVMHLMVLDEMPENKFDIEDEAVVWEIFRRTLVRNLDIFTEDEAPVVDELLFELGPVYELGLSSAKPIMEHQAKTGALEALEEKWYKPMIGDKPDKHAERRKETQKKHGGKGGGTDRLTKPGKWVRDLGKKIRKKLGTGEFQDQGAEGMSKTQMVGAAAVAAAAIYASYKIYKKYKADRPKAIKAQIASLKQSIGGCAKTNNAAKCKSIINAKISKLQSKLA